MCYSRFVPQKAIFKSSQGLAHCCEQGGARIQAALALDVSYVTLNERNFLYCMQFN